MATTPPREFKTGTGMAKPRAVTVAQVGIWLQPFAFVCGGVAPVVFWIPAFGAFALANLAARLPEFVHTAIVWFLVPSLALVIVFNVWITNRIGKQRRWAATTAVTLSACSALWTIIFCVDLAATGAVEFSGIGFTIGTAVPVLATQAMTAFGLRTPAAKRWFANRDGSVRNLAE